VPVCGDSVERPRIERGAVELNRGVLPRGARPRSSGLEASSPSSRPSSRATCSIRCAGSAGRDSNVPARTRWHQMRQRPSQAPSRAVDLSLRALSGTSAIIDALRLKEVLGCIDPGNKNPCFAGILESSDGRGNGFACVRRFALSRIAADCQPPWGAARSCRCRAGFGRRDHGRRYTQSAVSRRTDWSRAGLSKRRAGGGTPPIWADLA
jgi:hypothetical protein